jgi:hypothetical protein
MSSQKLGETQPQSVKTKGASSLTDLNGSGATVHLVKIMLTVL